MNPPNITLVPLSPNQLPGMEDHPTIADDIQFHHHGEIGKGGHALAMHFSVENKQTGCNGVYTHTEVDRPDGSVFHRRGYLFIHGDSCACLVPGEPTHFSDTAPRHLESHAAALVAAGKICERGSGVLVMRLFLGLPVHGEGLRIHEGVGLDLDVPQQKTDGEKHEKKANENGDIKRDKEHDSVTVGRKGEDEKQTPWLRLL